MANSGCGCNARGIAARNCLSHHGADDRGQVPQNRFPGRFDPVDPCSIADALRTLWLDDAAGDLQVMRGRAHVAMFSWRAMGERYGAVLDQASKIGRRTAAA